MGTYRYQIRELATGRVAIRERDTKDGSRSSFMWLEGNFACDCNRRLEFDRAMGTVSPSDAYTCNVDANAYVFDWVELDGVRFIENDQETSAAQS